MLHVTKVAAEYYFRLIEKQGRAAADRMFDNYVRLFNRVIEYSKDTPGVAGILVKSFSYLRNLFKEKGLIKELARRISTKEKDIEKFDLNFIRERLSAVIGNEVS